MESVKINETPVRTSVNFNINNIEIENINEKINSEFRNVNIAKLSDGIFIDSNVDNVNLKYGLGDWFNKQVNKQANYMANIVVHSEADQEAELEFNFNDENQSLISNIVVDADENAKATITLKYETIDSSEAYNNSIIRVNAKKNSVLNVIIVNFMNEFSNNYISIENNIDDNAVVNYYIVDFGGAKSITNYYSNIYGENADNKLNTIYLGRNSQIFDFNYIAELYGKKSNIDIEVQGALNDNSKKHFKGTIDFKKGCKKATGNENENCMLLSDKARSIALPMLLCSEEEVEGNHSSSAGKIGEKELFYIMSRGFNIKEAMQLMVRAKFNNILDGINNDKLKDMIIMKMEEILN